MYSHAPSLVIVVAVAENGVIGCHGDLPWHLPADLKRVRHLTLGKPLIMGRKTFESIGRPLPGRQTIVLTKDQKFSPPGVVVSATFDEALQKGKQIALSMKADEVIVFGGALVYEYALPIAEKIYKTEVHICPVGDTYFPEYNMDDWSETERRYVAASGTMDIAHSYVCLKRSKTNKGH
ncbi:MAG: hypothetical protein CMM58_10195 [Rhodospirillaceae bacterium]|nr:hypothetical protein [Rhodospirillaceae bacterium]|tara:strand:- start:631 stop:1167 length:537 start_codon:yes stop_codon:yes gene_type:complete